MLQQPRLAGGGQEGFAPAAMGLRLEGAARFEVLTNPAHGRDAVAETGGNLGRAFALVVELNDALADSFRDGFHNQNLPPITRCSLHYLWKRSKAMRSSKLAGFHSLSTCRF
jgi:hypothetical protein